MPTLGPITPEYLAPYIEHSLRHRAEIAESDWIYHPFQGPELRTLFRDRETLKRRWKQSLDVPGWERVWIFQDEGKSEIRASLEIKTFELTANLHRGILSMGVEAAWRGKGIGKELFSAARRWVARFTKLDILHLRVLGGNHPAIQFYSQLGFRHLAEIPDFFRINGKSYSDCVMALDLRT